MTHNNDAIPIVKKANSSVFRHQSRRKKEYYVHQRITPKGNVTYYLSAKDQGNILEKLPDGYEIYDHPETNQAFIRPIQPKIISEEELKAVDEYMNKFSDVEHFRIDAQKNSIVIYTTENRPPVSEIFAKLFNIPVNPEFDTFAEDLKNSIPDFPTDIDERFLVYQPMLRFVLINEEKRTFTAQRWCFRGAIDSWISLLLAGYLEELCKTFFPHLNKESFYELT